MSLNCITNTHMVPFLSISIFITQKHKALIIVTIRDSWEQTLQEQIRRQHAAKSPTCLGEWDTVAQSPENNNP